MSSKSVFIGLLVVSNVVSKRGGQLAQLIKQSYPQSLASLIDSHMKREQLIDYRLVLFQHTGGLMGNSLRESLCLTLCAHLNFCFSEKNFGVCFFGVGSVLQVLLPSLRNHK